MPASKLAKYGYKDMHQFRNWRWFKGLGGGPLVRSRLAPDRHLQLVDGHTPKSVIASGGLDYYKNHDWYDNAMVIYEYPLAQGVARAFYQVQTTTSAGGGYFEMFMGDDGTIKMSEDPSLCAIYREARADVSLMGRPGTEGLRPRQADFCRGRSESGRARNRAIGGVRDSGVLQ